MWQINIKEKLEEAKLTWKCYMASNAQDSTTCAQLLFEGQLPWPASHVTNAFNYIKNGVS